jgi:hypothetical protein
MRDVVSQMHFYSTKRILHFDNFLKDCKSGGLPYYSVIESANLSRAEETTSIRQRASALGRSHRQHLQCAQGRPLLALDNAHHHL